MHGSKDKFRRTKPEPSQYDELDQQYFEEYGIPEDTYRADELHVKHEREAARILRTSQWWKNLRACGKCHYCGKSVPPSELTMDHIIPIARGGKSIPANIVPCCKECNTAKHSQLPTEMN